MQLSDGAGPGRPRDARSRAAPAFSRPGLCPLPGWDKGRDRYDIAGLRVIHVWVI